MSLPRKLGAGLLAALLLLGARVAGRAQGLALAVSETAGVARQNEIVTSGVPFPMGSLGTNVAIRLVGPDGPVPVQSQVTATWKDGSVKWLLLDFPANLQPSETAQYILAWGKVTKTAQGTLPEVQTRQEPNAVVVNTGPLQFSVSKTNFSIFDSAWVDRNGDGKFDPSEQVVKEGLRQTIAVYADSGPNNGKGPVEPLNTLPPEEVLVEETGPFRTVVRVAGWAVDPSGARVARYLCRVYAGAGSTMVKVFHTLTQTSPTRKMLWVKDVSLHLKPALDSAPDYLFGASPEPLGGPAAKPVALLQLGEGEFSFASETGETKKGAKASGWVRLGNGKKGLLVGVGHFRGQFPKALEASPNGLRVGLYPAEEPEPFGMDQGSAKTHEVVFDFNAASLTPAQCGARILAEESPLFALAAPSWYCDSKVFGDIAPFDFDLFPDYETLAEAGADRLAMNMATGLRNWGDVRRGARSVGRDSNPGLEGEVHRGLVVQFARTALRKYLDVAVIMATRHSDIASNGKPQPPGKQGSSQIGAKAGFDPAFIRGLLDTWRLTGNRRCLETAVGLGDYLAKSAREIGNEAGLGPVLIGLLPVYEATWDRKYLEAARETVDRLLTSLDSKGQVQPGRDVASFGGAEAVGLVEYQRLTGDPLAAEAALRVVRRLRGMIPDNAGGALEALAWAYLKTSDPDSLDFLKLSYESTMTRQVLGNALEPESVAISAAAAHALPFLPKSGFAAKPADPLELSAEALSGQNGLQAHHVPSGDADLYLNIQGDEVAQIVVVRKGAWKASAKAILYTPSGQVAQTWVFPKEAVVAQRQAAAVTPTEKGTYRLSLRSASVLNAKTGSSVTWDIATSRPIQAVLATPANQGLEFVASSLFSAPKGDADTIEIELIGEGEGFKKATLCDPEDNPVATVVAFVESGDKGRHQYKLSAPIPPRHANGVWKLDLQDVSIAKMNGLAPYFSTSRQGFFRPDKR